MSEIQKSQTSLSRDTQARELRKVIGLRDLMTLRSSAVGTCLALDFSGSMNVSLMSGGKRVDKLREAIAELPATPSITFNSDKIAYHSEQSTAIETWPCGGTPMDKAFVEAKDKGFRRVVVVTDGQPDSQERALTAAEGLQIDAIYCGDGPIPQFLQDLCSRTGGSFQDVKVDSTQGSLLLEQAIRGLLAGGK